MRDTTTTTPTALGARKGFVRKSLEGLDEGGALPITNERLDSGTIRSGAKLLFRAHFSLILFFRVAFVVVSLIVSGILLLLILSSSSSSSSTSSSSLLLPKRHPWVLVAFPHVFLPPPAPVFVLRIFFVVHLIFFCTWRVGTPAGSSTVGGGT